MFLECSYLTTTRKMIAHPFTPFVIVLCFIVGNLLFNFWQQNINCFKHFLCFFFRQSTCFFSIYLFDNLPISHLGSRIIFSWLLSKTANKKLLFYSHFFSLYPYLLHTHNTIQPPQKNK